MQTPATSPAFTAILFSLSGCLVDFGARTIPLTLQRLYPTAVNQQSLPQALGREPLTTEWLAYQQAL